MKTFSVSQSIVGIVLAIATMGLLFLFAPYSAVAVDPCAVDDTTCVSVAQNALSTAATLTPAEGVDTNVIPMAQAIVDAASTGVVVSVTSSANSQVATDGAITYGTSSVTGDVTFHLAKNEASLDQAMSVTVPQAIPNYADIFAEVTSTLSAQGITTNISDCAATPTACTGLSFEKAGYGKISFSAELDLTDAATVATLQALGAGGLDIDRGTITFDATVGDAFVTLGGSLEMYGLYFDNGATPEILVDGVAATGADVLDVMYADGTLTFEALHFSTFSISDIVNTRTGAGYNTIQEAIDAAEAGDTISLAAGTYLVTSQINISKPISLVGTDAVTIKADNASWSTVNGYKHLIGVYSGTAENPVTLSNVMLDANGQNYGLNTYGNAYLVLSDVTVKNGKGAGITVNGSTVTGTNVHTSGNAWGAINVDPGTGVTTPSVLTLNSGTLAEDTQIWSDGSKVTETATVTVEATGYSMYTYAGSTVKRWANKPLTKVVTLSSAPTVLYTTIKSALDAAADGETINVMAGEYNLVKDDTTVIEGQTGWYLPITKNGITLQGVDANGNPITDATATLATIYSTQETANGNWSTQNLITVFADDVTIQGLTVMNKISPNKGIEVLGDNFTAQYNTFAPVPTSLFPNANNYNGSDLTKYGSGPYFNNNGATETRTGTVKDNYFVNSGISFDSFGDNWTMTITGNTFDGNRIWKSGGTDYYYSSIGATSWASPEVLDFSGSQIDIHENKFINMANDQMLLKTKTGMVGTFDATENWWGTDDEAILSARVAAGIVTYSPWYADDTMTTLSFTTDTEGDATVGDDPITGVVKGVASYTIPAGTTISGGTSWDGTIDAPVVTGSYTLTADTGYTAEAIEAIEVGLPDTELIFDKGVRLEFTGQAGKLVGWSRNSTFTQITETCSADSQIAGDALAAGADCKIDVGDDLIVWTKHFTAYIVYTQTKNTTSGGGGGGGGGIFGTTYTMPGATTTTTTGTTSGVTGQVLGIETYRFTTDLRMGMRGEDVTELQKRLTTEGFYSGPVTGFFGPLTQQAVIAYQKAKGITPAIGYVGVKTRAVLNDGPAQEPVITLDNQAQLEDVRVQLAAALEALQKIMQRLNELRGN